jgi:pilus assembly protein CpaC
MRHVKRWMFSGVAGLLLATGHLNAQAPKSGEGMPLAKSNAPLAKIDQLGAVIVPVQATVRLQLRSKQPIKKIDYDREQIIEVRADAMDTKSVIILGLSIGRVKLELTDVEGGKETYEILVQNDLELARTILKRAVPTANVDIIQGPGSTLILTGHVARPDDVDAITRITTASLPNASIVNAIQMSGVQQVMLDVTVASVNRTKARSRGFNFILSGTTGSVGSVFGGLTTVGAGAAAAAGGAVGINSTQLTASPSATANVVFGLVPPGLQTLIQALKTENIAKILANPKLVTSSGRPANFLAGGRQATLSGSSGINGPGVAYEEIGTELQFLPIVYGNGKIYLEVAPRIRNVNQGLGITTSFGTVPGFDEQSVRTSVVLEPGQTFAIGGLISTSTQASSAKVPFLGDLPFMGAFFTVNSWTDNEQELVILVTPYLVDAMDHTQLPKRLPGRETRSPDDFEFYLETMLELPRGQRNVFEGRRYKAPWKNDPTAAIFPCLSGNCAEPGFAAPATLLPVTEVAPTQLPVVEPKKVEPKKVEPKKVEPNVEITEIINGNDQPALIPPVIPTSLPKPAPVPMNQELTIPSLPPVPQR